MPIIIKAATRPEELGGLYGLRHAVLVEEQGLFKATGRDRLSDWLDELSSTANILAIDGDVVIGGLRLFQYPPPVAAERGRDGLAPFVPLRAQRVAVADMFCLDKKYRDRPRITYTMICMGTYWAMAEGFSHVMTEADAHLVPQLEELGFEPAGPAVDRPGDAGGRPPMIVNLNDLSDPFLEVARRQGLTDHLIIFPRELYRDGETVIECDRRMDAAYVIADGSVAVHAGDSPIETSGDSLLAELGPGEIFGELALLTNRPRSADVVAQGDLDLMVLDREVFRQEIIANPELQLTLLEQVGRRLSGTIEHLTIMKDVAERDGLTGIHNRRVFDMTFERIFRHARRDHETLAVMMVDVDHFKAYNDTYGHPQGDKCLKKIARSVSKVAGRPLDITARYGGEEFVAVWSGAGRKFVETMAENLRADIIDQNLEHSASPVADCVTVSAGVIIGVPAGDLTPENFLQMADDCLYQAKEQGRNRVVIKELDG